MFRLKKRGNNPKYNINETCLACKHILRDNKPILYIKRDKNKGDYQFLCGLDDHTETDMKNITLGEMIKVNGKIEKLLPLELGIELTWQYSQGKGLELKKFIQEGVNNIIQEDIKNGKVSMSQLYNNGEIVYYNGRNGTWFDWNINERSSWFTVCFNDAKIMGYISIAIFKDGTVSGYKWGNYGQDEAENVSLGKLNIQDVEYFLRLLLQQTDDKGIFDVSRDSINWESPIFLEPLEEEEN